METLLNILLVIIAIALGVHVFQRVVKDFKRRDIFYGIEGEE